jgi:hypothetical protein
MLTRVATGRARQRYRPAVNVVRAHQKLIRRLDRDAIRSAVQDHALVTTSDDILFELLCGFRIENLLIKAGWNVSHPGLVRNRFLTARKASRRLTLYYQSVPGVLSKGARYQGIQRAHGFADIGRLRPDFIIELDGDEGRRWTLVEVKRGEKRSVEESARQALVDLLAYRRDYGARLGRSVSPYGLGIAWGAELDPAAGSEILLCTQDRLDAALSMIECF